MTRRILVTGGCGFIGSNFVRHLLRERPAWSVTNLDKLTYSGNLANLADVAGHPRYTFVHGDIVDRALVDRLVRDCDAVFGSRMLGGRPIEGGMPRWKYWANLFLTAVANASFYVFLSEYHSGLRAYTRHYLETCDLEANAEGFVFDTQIIAQGVWHGMRIREVPIQTRYFAEASQIGFWRSCEYGFGVLGTLLRYKLHKRGLWRWKLLGDRAGGHAAAAAR